MGGGGAGAAIAVIGSLMWPSVGSVGVTGGPVKLSRDGTVGENLIIIRCCNIGSAMRIVVEGVLRYTR